MNQIKSETPAYEMYQDTQTLLISVNLVFNIFLNGSTARMGPGRFFSLLIYSQSVGLLG
jgi:hypothetical protein